MRKYVLSLLAVFLAISFCRAQVPSSSPWNGIIPAVMNAAGGSYDNASSYYRYEWSFGEMVLIQAFAPQDSSVLLTQGVLQPCTDKGPSPYSLVWNPGEYRIFPNPTSGAFELDFFVNRPGHMRLELIDAMGRVLEVRDYHYDGCCRIENYDLSKYPDGVYMVVASLRPDQNRPGDDQSIIRHSGLRVVKATPN